jgi:hypothetical protein
LADHAAGHGIDFVDAPVSGGHAAAAGRCSRRFPSRSSTGDRSAPASTASCSTTR